MRLDTNIILHAIPAFLLLTIIESAYLARQRKLDTKQKSLASFWLGCGYVLLALITKEELRGTSPVYNQISLPIKQNNMKRTVVTAGLPA